MKLDMSRELPTMPATRATEWSLFWTNRIAVYWSLGYVNPSHYWKADI